MVRNNSEAAEPVAPTATFSHRTMSRSSFHTYIDQVFGGRRKRPLTLLADYSYVEYFNAPDGLIVLAHHDTIAGQVDGVHPSALSHHIDNDFNIIESLGGKTSGYAVHYMSRKQQGTLVLGAFGRMIRSGDPEAPALTCKQEVFASLEIFHGPRGPIVAATEDAETVHVIDCTPVAPGEAA